MVAAAWIVFMISIGIVAAIAVVLSRKHPADLRPADPDVEDVIEEEPVPVPRPGRVVPDEPDEIVLDDDRPRPE